MTDYIPTPILVTAPAAEPVSLAEAKAHCRVDFADEDTLISGIITAARLKMEVALDRQLVTARWSVKYPHFPGWSWDLPYPPLQSVTSIVYKDAALVNQTLATSVYDVITWLTPGRVQLKNSQSWPSTGISPEAVTVTFDAGYGAAAAVPQLVKEGILLLVGHWYTYREAVATTGISTMPLPLAFDSIVSAARAYRF